MRTDLEYHSTRTYARHEAARNDATARTHVEDDERRFVTRKDHDGDLHPGDVASAATLDRGADTFVAEDPHLTEDRDDDAVTADLLDQHGRAEAALGHFALARALHERAIAIRRHHFGEADPRRVQSLTFLGTLALRENKLGQAQWLYDQAHAAALKLHGPDHPATAMTLNNLGVLARRRRDPARASDHYEEALARKLAAHGWDHPSVATTLVNLGNLTRATGDYKAAVHYYARACEIFEAHEGELSRGLATALVGMGRVHLSMGITTTAVWMLERALHIREAHHVTPSQLAGVRFLLATAMEFNNPARARDLVVATLASYGSAEHPDPRNIASMHAWLARFDKKHSAAGQPAA